MKSIIAINGIMGVGKSTIGKKLAEKINYYFIDCDNEIEDRYKKPINQIFEEDGEIFFRQQELNLIKELSNRNEKLVIALGGGAYMNQEVREILKQKATTIWLKAKLDDIYGRLKNKTNRPLLNKNNRKEILRNLIKTRNPIYSESDLTIEISGKTSDYLTKEIIDLLNKN